VNEQPPLPPPPTQSSGAGCFARGCLIAVVALVVFAVLLGVGGTILYRRAVVHFTAAQAVEVPVAVISNEQYQTARGNLDRLRNAIGANREETIVFGATDLNAIVAHEQEFSGARGRVRFGIADSNMTVDLSVPLESIRLAGFSHRWFNGSVRFSFAYENEQFDFAPLAVQAGTWSVPEWLLTSEFSSSFSRTFSQRFHDEMQAKPQGREVWNHLKSIRLQDDKLVVTTQPSSR